MTDRNTIDPTPMNPDSTMKRFKRPLIWGSVAVIMALGLSWWNNQQTERRADIVRNDLTELCNAIHARSVQPEHRALIDSNMTIAVIDAIETRLDQLTIQNPHPQWRFDIESLEVSADRETFHVAASFDQQPVLTLRVLRLDPISQTLIIGYDATTPSDSEGS